MFTKITLATLISVQTFFFLSLPISTFAQSQAKSDDSASFYINRGLARYESGKWKKAIADFDTVLIRDPHNSTIFNARGLAWLALKEYGMATRDFNQAIKLDPGFAKAYANRGLAQLRQKHEAKASQDFAKCLELDGTLKSYVEELKGNGSQK